MKRINKSKKLISSLLILIIALTILPNFGIEAFAAPGGIDDGDTDNEITEFGYTAQCGENVNCTFDNTEEILTITGSGDMYDYDSESNQSPFANIVNIRGVVIESGVTSIGAYAFYGCINLTDVTFTSTVTRISEGAFAGCTSLKNITVPETVSSIGANAFTAVEEIVIDNPSCGISDQAINSDAVIRGYANSTAHQYALKNSNEFVRISGGVDGSDTYEQPFLDYSGSCGENVTFNFEELTGTLTISGSGDMTDYSVNSSNYSPFHGVGDIKSVVIQNGVTSIGDDAFRSCKNIESLTIGDTVNHIGGGAFLGCTKLKSVIMPDSITSIDDGAFYNCTALETVKLSNELTEISGYVFCDCKSLKSIEFPEKITTIKGSSFYGCDSFTSVVIPQNVTFVGYGAFDGCVKLEKVTILNKNCEIQDTDSSNIVFTKFAVLYVKQNSLAAQYAKKYNYDIVYICSDGDENHNLCYKGYFFEDSKFIEKYECSECGYTVRRDVNDSVVPCAGEHQFNAGEVVIVYDSDNDEKQTYKKSVCANCGFTGFEHLTPSGQSGDDSCYYIDTDKSEVHFIGSGNIVGSYYPQMASELYYIELSDYNDNIEKAVVENGITSIGTGTFKNLTNLTEVDIAPSVTTIGYYAFDGCTALTSFTVPDTVKTLGYAPFRGCTALKNVTIGSGITDVYNGLFNGCDNVETITIGTGVKSISAYTFRDLTNLTSVTLNKNIASIDKDAFKGCTSLDAINYSGTTTQWYNYNYSFDFENDADGAVSVKCSDGIFMSTKNGDYVVVDGVKYTPDRKTLVEYPSNINKTAFSVPNTVEKIGDNSFTNDNLKSVAVSKKVKVIGKAAFNECPNLSTVKFAENSELTTIKESAFKDTSIETIELPEKLNTVEAMAFSAPKLSSINATKPANLTINPDVCKGIDSPTWLTTENTMTQKNAIKVKCPSVVTNVPYQMYTGKAIMPKGIVLKDSKSGKVLKQGTDYVISLPKNKIYKNVGTAKLVISGKGSYEKKINSSTVDYRIFKASVVLSSRAYTYDGKPKAPAIKVTINDGRGYKSLSGKKYKTSYTNGRKNVGTYNAKVTFCNGYYGSHITQYKIYPSAPKIAKLTPGKKSFMASWQRQKSQVSGYQVQYCVNKNFRGAKTKTVNGNGKKSSYRKITKVAGNKKYYVRVRTFKTVGKAKYYSSWSKVKAVKTKK